MRYAREYRDNIEALQRVLVTTSSGAQIPITQDAEIHFRTGPPMLRNEDGQLVGFVFIDINEAIGIADYVELAQQVVQDRVALAAGYRLEWAGQFKYFARAKERLHVLVPMTLFAILFMLFFHRKSIAETLIIMTALPMSVVGSIWLLAFLEYKLSVAVGMIAVAGLAVELGLLMMLYLDIAWRKAHDEGQLKIPMGLSKAIIGGATLRIRPMLMTTLTLLIGLMPIMLSDGAGSDVMKRIAAPMIGGIGTSLFMVLIVFPAIFSLWRDRSDG